VTVKYEINLLIYLV